MTLIRSIVKTIVNIQDAISVSEYDSDMDEAKNHTHDWLAANGWGYRHCYITDGRKIYVAILNIGHSADGRNIMYAVRVNKKGGVDVDETPLNREFDKEPPLYNSGIAQNSEDVKSNYGTKNSDISYSKKDSSGNTLSEGQQEYFKDSTTVEIEPRYRSIYPLEQCGFGKPDYSSNGRCHGAMHAKSTYADV